MSDSTVERKEQCPQCAENGGDTSEDNLVVYEDGGKHCFACGYNSQPKKSEKELYRGLDLSKHKHAVFQPSGHLAFRYSHGWKFKDVNDKSFWWGKQSEPKNCRMYLLDTHAEYEYGQALYLTEGEEDTLSCREVGFISGSLHSGAGSVKQCFNHDLEELRQYKEIVLAFDNDEAGKKATEEAKFILKEHNISYKLVDFGNYKDANEVLVKAGRQALIDILNNAREETPKGLILGRDLDFVTLKEEKIESIRGGFKCVNEGLGDGYELGCFYNVYAGTGIGKSTFMRTEGLFFLQQKRSVANFFLEENEKMTPLAYLALMYNVPLGELRRNRHLLTEQQWDEGQQFISDSNVTFLGREYLKTSSNVLRDLEYLINDKGFDIILLDHLSYLIGRSGISKHGERRDIDELVYAIQDLAQKSKAIIISACHITESQSKKRWDEGEIPNIQSGRGSKALGQIPDGIIGLARNMVDPSIKNVTDIYILKNRWGADIGKVGSAIYYKDTGRMLEK